MILFRNPGLIDLATVRTMGVNVKASPTAFGYFGTGMKFAIATVLRGGGKITLFRGNDDHEFGARETEIRGKTFHIVTLDGEDLGFTTDLGRNWEPWMVLREFGCNAMDEEGGFERQEDDALWSSGPDETVFCVIWDKLDQAYELRSQVFFNSDDAQLLANTSKLQVLHEPSGHIFYRGIRALKLERPSEFTYNILAPMTLSEDRHIISEYYPREHIRSFWLECDDKEALTAALTADKGKYEYHLDYHNSHSVDPSKAFLDVCYEQSAKNRDKLSPNAYQVFMKNVRKSSQSGGFSSSRLSQDAFAQVLEELEAIFSNIIPNPDATEPDAYNRWVEDPLGLETAQFVLQDDLPNDQLSLYEDGRIYIARNLLRQSRRTIAREVLMRLIDRVPLYGAADTAAFLIPVVLQTSSALRIDLADRRPPEPQQIIDSPEEETQDVELVDNLDF